MFGLGMAAAGARRTAVLVQGDEVLDLTAALADVAAGRTLDGTDTMALLRDWDQALPVLTAVAAAPGRAAYRLSRSAVRWLPPLCYPDKVLCAGSNYPAHAREMGGTPQNPDEANPYFFTKPPRHTFVADGDNIVLPLLAKKVDWEVELAIVIGRRAKNVAVADALNYVAGYTVFNDISSRDRTHRTDSRFTTDWVGGKCSDTYAPIGPVFVPRQFVPDWRALHLRLSVSGTVKQDELAGAMIQPVEKQIHFASYIMTLEPGDVIATGTPSGVGAGRGEFLRTGDVVVAEIEGIGRLTNRCVAEE